MNILFIHLSDWHIKNESAFNDLHIRKIVDSINALGHFERVIIIASGDLAFSGQKAQYEIAAYFIGNIIAKIKSIHTEIGFVDVLCVPGNHDIDYGNIPMRHSDLQDIFSNDEYVDRIDAELDCQKAFFEFAKRNRCFTSSKTYEQRFLVIDGFKIDARLINTGMFSLRDDEDKALHYLGKEDILALDNQSDADLVITVMHHSPEWYNDKQKHEIEAAINRRCHILFHGHEHFQAEKSITYENNAPVIIQSCGCLCENDKWEESSYYLGVFDTVEKTYRRIKMRWNVNSNQYEPDSDVRSKIHNKSVDSCPIAPLDDFLKSIKKDPMFDLSEDFQNYYVFPRIKVEDVSGKSNRDIVSFDSFDSELKSQKRIVIGGACGSGKTTLLRYLYIQYTKNYPVVFCSPEYIRGKNPEKIIRSCFQEAYGGDESTYVKFSQFPKEEKVIIVDDIDEIRDDLRANLLSYINDNFGLCIFTTRELIELNLQQSLEMYFKLSDCPTRYVITGVYADKRNELVEKVVNILSPSAKDVRKTTKILTDALTQQRKLINLTPEFIIKYVVYYCKNLSEVSDNTPGVFSKVFEMNLTSSLYPFATPQLSVDKMLTILSKIAHYIHFAAGKKYPIPESNIIAIIQQYNDEYDTEINCTSLIEKLVYAKVIAFDKDRNGYIFTNRNYLAYFVAKEVNRSFNDTMNENELRQILKLACFGINADILMFISYITDNIRILRLIWDMANEYTITWQEFDFETNKPEYLTVSSISGILPISNDSLEQERRAIVQNEQDDENNRTIINLYDYNEDTADELLNQIIRAVNLQIIVARCLPNFEHIMKKDDKQKFVKLLYSMPNRIFLRWASEANNEVHGLIAYIKAQNVEYGSEQKVTDDKVLQAIQWISMSLLLNLYNIPVMFAAQESTYKYLVDFDTSEKSTYSMEKIMIYEKMEDVPHFIEEVKRFIPAKKNNIVFTTIQRIVHHGIVHMEKLSQGQVQSLQDKFLIAPRESQKRAIIAERSKNQWQKK